MAVTSDFYEMLGARGPSTGPEVGVYNIGISLFVAFSHILPANDTFTYQYHNRIGVFYTYTYFVSASQFKRLHI